MQPKNLYLIEGPEAFSTGEMENVAIKHGCLVLEHQAGQRVLAGGYTAKQAQLPAFDRLVASWNADTPPGTMVEVQARVKAEGTWSRWFSFGRWSPFCRRTSFSERGTVADMDTDTLIVRSSQGATEAQLRVYLYTEQENVTPRVRLLAVTVRPVRWEQKEGAPVRRQLYLPAYSQLNRDPMIGSSICSPVTVTCLMNRWGSDLLPEEVAHVCYDADYHGFGNWAFVAAAAGSFGYRAYAAYLDLEGLRREIREGYSVGVSVRYANDPELARKENLPYLEGAPGITHGHLLAVRGFEQDGETEYVLVNDSYAASDGQAARRYRLDQFLNAWHNRMAYIVHPGPREAGAAAPIRRRAQLKAAAQPGEYLFEVKGETRTLPADFLGTKEEPGGTLACTIQDGVAYATTAHKSFRYLTVGENGGVLLPQEAVETDQRVTVYAIDTRGEMLVAEK